MAIRANINNPKFAQFVFASEAGYERATVELRLMDAISMPTTTPKQPGRHQYNCHATMPARNFWEACEDVRAPEPNATIIHIKKTQQIQINGHDCAPAPDHRLNDDYEKLYANPRLFERLVEVSHFADYLTIGLDCSLPVYFSLTCSGGARMMCYFENKNQLL